MFKYQLSIISFTINGEILSRQIKKILDEKYKNCDTKTYSVKSECTDSIYVDDAKAWTKEQFEKKNVIVFIGACGIAVRMISPYVKDKLTDSPVLVIDEAGKFVIPVLSGHMGGANEVADCISESIGAIPVITTATDVNRKLAIDMFAKNHDLSISNRDGIAKISSKVLKNKKLTFSIADEYKEKVDVCITTDQHNESLLTLIPKEYVIGIGCRKGKESAELEEFINKRLREENISWNQIKAIATIDIKKDEKAILELVRKNNTDFVTYTSDELMNVKGEFSSSDFVKKKTGTDNVCERAALAYCGIGGKLISKKSILNGMTMAIAKKEWRLTIYEE